MDKVIANLDCGISVSVVARSFKTSRQTIIRKERGRQKCEFVDRIFLATLINLMALKR